MKRIAFCGLAVTLLGLAPAATAVDTAPTPAASPSSVTVEVASILGSGCRAGTAAVTAAADGTSFTVAYSSFLASVGESGSSRVNCQMSLRVNVPDGMTYAVDQVTTQFVPDLAVGATGTAQVALYFQGQSTTVSRQTTLSGPAEPGRYPLRAVQAIADEDLVWHPCGAQRNLNVNTTLRVSGTGPSSLRMDATNSEDLQLVWAQCPGSTPEPTSPEPTTPEVTSPVPSTPEVTSPEPTSPEPTTPEVTSPVPSTPEVTSPVPSTPEVTSPAPSTGDPDAVPADFAVDVVTVNGSGCPVGTAAVQVSPDRHGFAVTYSDYTAQVGPGVSATESRKNCQLNLRINTPASHTFAVSGITHEGLANLAEGATGVERTNYYFQGMSSNQSDSHTINGPLTGPWQTEDLIGTAALVWHPCGEQRNLNINSELRVNKGTSAADAVSSLSMSRSDAQDLRLAWREC